MEVPQGSLEAHEDPKPMGAGMGVVGGHLPQMPENGALEAPLRFPKPSSGQDHPLGSDQWLERGLKTALQAQIASQATGTTPGEQLISGLAEAIQEPGDATNSVGNPDFTGGNHQKRTQQDSGGASAYTVVPGPLKDYIIEAMAPIEAQIDKNEDTLRAYMGLVQAYITRIDFLEKTMQALQASAHPAPNTSLAHDVKVSSLLPSPVAKNGLAPTKKGQAPDARDLAPGLIGRQDPPQYQTPKDHTDPALPTPEAPRRVAQAYKASQAALADKPPLVAPTTKPAQGPPTSKPTPPSQVPAPKSQILTAKDSQANAGGWKTVQYGRQKAVPIAPSKPRQPAAKPTNTQSKEERHLIFRRQAPTTTARHDTQDIQLALN
jgi:hypothetical protein